MPKFRKRQDEIEAMPVSRLHYLAANDWWSLPDLIQAAYEKGKVRFLNNPTRIEISMPWWTETAFADDWIIYYRDGSLCPCKADEFEKKYEPA